MPFILCTAVSVAAAETVPQVIGFHSIITDEGGNPVPDGDIGIRFRITDADGVVLYEEQQTVAAYGGIVSALIGNGLTSEGSPTGGIPQSAMAPQGARFIEVEAAGFVPLPPMEIASVPYAVYAEQALGVADKSISFDSLDAEAMKRIAEELTGGKDSSQILLRDELPTLYSAPTASSTIGVAQGLAYSSADYLQGALVDLDHAIADGNARITTEINDRSAAVSSEAQTRSAADSSEANVRAAADAAANASISNLDGRMQAIENPQRLSYGRSSWGTVTCGGAGDVHGQNVVFAGKSGDTASVAFVQPMSDAYYAVVVTPTANGGDAYSNGLNPLLAYNKSAAGFSVNCHAVPSVDFIVMGN